jgi:leucyl aminopeptidase (aminopeptidase T)
VPLVGILAYEETGGHGAPLPQTGTLISGGTTTDSVNIVETLSAADIQLALTKFSATAPLKFGLDGKRRAVSMPGVDEAMEPAMSADYGQIAQQIDRLLPILGQFDKYTIVFTVPGQQPHILEVDTRERHFHGDDGFCREPGKLINFPAGEVYIAPFEGVGTRTRGRIPVFFDAESPVPVLLTVESNLIVLDGATLAQLPANVREDLQRKPGNVNIAEIALGLNPNTRIHPATPTLELEKSLGFHWAYGISAHLGGAVDDSTADVHQDYVYSARDPRCSINVYGTGPAHSDPVLIVSNGLPVIR